MVIKHYLIYSKENLFINRSLDICKYWCFTSLHISLTGSNELAKTLFNILIQSFSQIKTEEGATMSRTSKVIVIKILEKVLGKRLK